ncbi:MAG: AMP-binding protein [Myxococcota bacterium]|nr:AMP-binding protein [Myxococcota bacterium]
MKDIVWEPRGEYIENSNVVRFMRKHGLRTFEELHRWSVEDIGRFWDACLEDRGVEWFRKYDKTYDTGDSKSFEWTRWFVGGKINIAHNALDRHARTPASADRPAFIWEGEDGAVQEWSYRRLYEEANRCANALRSLGIGKGDAVGFYVPMTPELVVAFWACLKIGAAIVPVFSGFGPQALAVRLQDAGARLLFTADGSYRRGKTFRIKPGADEAVAAAPSVERVIVVRRLGADVPMTPGRDIWWHDIVPRQSPEAVTEPLDAEHRSMILFSSGTTGRPKGTVHTHAGALAQMAKELGFAFDVGPDSRFFWFTDIGWMMGPWMIVGVQHHGGMHFIYEGAPDHPGPDRIWDMIERHRLTHLGISPTAIRLLRRSDDSWVDRHAMPTLRYLGSTGEVWDRESWLWCFHKVGKGRLPIINISGGTEMVGCLVSPLPITALKPCTLRGPGLGMDVDVLDDDGRPVRGAVGHLVCRQPCPSFTKGFLGDPERYIETYFSRWPGVWYHGDYASIDEDGFLFLHGRSDDTIKVAGKRTGPAEFESALMEHPAVAEACAVGVPHDIKGETVVCFAVLRANHEPTDALREELKDQVVKALGKTLRPDDLRFVSALPKTRSAKIVRAAVRRKWLGQPLGDLSSVENPDSLDEIAGSR